MNNYIEQGRINLQEQEEMKRSSREVFTGLIDILRDNGTHTYLLEFPLIRKSLIVDNTASGGQQTLPVMIWSRKDLEKTREINMTIEGVGHFRVDRKTTRTGENFVVSKKVKKHLI